MTRLASVVVAGAPSAWEACGFAVDSCGRIALGNGAIECRADDRGGLLALAVEGVTDLPADVDGVQLVPGSAVPASDHPNGAFELDHIVVMTDSLDRTSNAIDAALGLELRRVRETETVRQGFHRFDDQRGTRGCIIEVVETDRVDGASLWGLVVNVVDLDSAQQLIGADRIGLARPAVQRGRHIATVRSAAGLGAPVALMSPST